MAYSKLYRESGPIKMAPLALILWEREGPVDTKRISRSPLQVTKSL